MDALVNIDSVFSGHHLVDGGPALLLFTPLLCRSHPAGLGLEWQDPLFNLLGKRFSFYEWPSNKLPSWSNGTPLQYSCLENPMDGGAWWAAVHGVARSRTWLSDFTFTFHFHDWRRKWQPTPVFLPGESQGWGSLVGCRLWGRTVLDTTKVT